MGPGLGVCPSWDPARSTSCPARPRGRGQAPMEHRSRSGSPRLPHHISTLCPCSLYATSALHADPPRTPTIPPAVRSTIPSPCHGHLLSPELLELPRGLSSPTLCSAGHHSLGPDPQPVPQRGAPGGAGAHGCVCPCASTLPLAHTRPSPAPLVANAVRHGHAPQHGPADEAGMLRVRAPVRASPRAGHRTADTVQPGRDSLSSSLLPEPSQAAATDPCARDVSPAPTPLPFTELSQHGGGPRCSPPLQAAPLQPSTLPAAPCVATMPGSPAQPPQPGSPRGTGAAGPGLVGDIGSPWMARTLFRDWRGAAHTCPASAAWRWGRTPSRRTRGGGGEPGPGNSTHHA